jgi:hypothetical protein
MCLPPTHVSETLIVFCKSLSKLLELSLALENADEVDAAILAETMQNLVAEIVSEFTHAEMRVKPIPKVEIFRSCRFDGVADCIYCSARGGIFTRAFVTIRTWFTICVRASNSLNGGRCLRRITSRPPVTTHPLAALMRHGTRFNTPPIMSRRAIR